MKDLLRLKTKLKLKYLRKETEKEVKENFGYSPDSKTFNSLMNEMSIWSKIAENKYKDIYIEHINLL
jgi:predicted RNA-binding protein with RPS1 domain